MFRVRMAVVYWLLIVSMLALSSCLVDDITDAIEDAVGSYDDVKIDFQEISDQLGDGTLREADNANDLPNQIQQLIATQGQTGSDIVLLIDKTGSMSDDINAVKSGLTTIIDNLPVGARLGLATYGDKNNDGSDWYSSEPLTTDHSKIQLALNGITTTGGGDWPESVYDGIYKVMDEMLWESPEQRLIIVIGDASPLTGSKTEHSLSDLVLKAQASSPAIIVVPIIIKF